MGKKLKGRSSSSQCEREREGGRVRGTDAIVVWLASRPVRTVNELSLLLLLLLHANLIKSCNKIYGCLLGATLAGPQTSWIFLPAAGKGRRGARACQMPSSQGFRHFASSNICLPHLPAPSPCLPHFFATSCVCFSGLKQFAVFGRLLAGQML